MTKIVDYLHLIKNNIQTKLTYIISYTKMDFRDFPKTFKFIEGTIKVDMEL